MNVEAKQSRIGYLTVDNSDNQVVLIKENMEIKREDNGANTEVNTTLEVENPSIRTIRSMNLELAEDYTCLDDELPTSQGKETRQWAYNDKLHDVNVLLERPDSQIHLIRNFITQEECDAFQGAASSILHRGTVADGNGGSKLSENRKAWQAGIAVPWEKEADGDLLARYTRRMYAYANHATGYNLNVEGQEDIMSIQYFGHNGDHPIGSSYSPETPDRYTPHCDGDCHGLPHRKGARVATMVAYCTVPSKGGATNFKNVAAHVKPEFGAGVFFSYMNPDTKVMDTGWTTHSGCPVLEGTKRIVVHWMRVGVSTDEPWDSFNTLNLPKHSEQEYY
ncbi:prolyl 4-hydroxylase alpha-subunit [Fragilaria crotonensis]|nr:prolyl 4-hydroxylase alpha-subunit [Fragilaria crotonensis]